MTKEEAFKEFKKFVDDVRIKDFDELKGALDKMRTYCREMGMSEDDMSRIYSADMLRYLYDASHATRQ